MAQRAPHTLHHLGALHAHAPFLRQLIKLSACHPDRWHCRTQGRLAVATCSQCRFGKMARPSAFSRKVESPVRDSCCPSTRGMEQIFERKCPVPIVPGLSRPSVGQPSSVFQGGKFFGKWPQMLPYPVTIAFGKPLACFDAGRRRAAGDPATVCTMRREAGGSIAGPCMLSSSACRVSIRAVSASSILKGSGRSRTVRPR